jgi:hypothetical protein
MKILIQYQNADYPTIETGIREAVRLLKENGTPVETILRQSNLKLTTEESTNAQGFKVAFVNPKHIIDSTDISCQVSCLIYDWRGLRPQPTNPVQSPILVRGFTPIQIPIQFYTDTTTTPFKYYPEVLTHYFLHELAHAIIFLANTRGAGVPDTVHNDMTIGAYLKLIKDNYSKVVTSNVIAPRPQKQVTLGLGARGDRVIELQRFLGITADGIFGRATLQAVKNFQARNKLTPDGIVGPRTQAVIESLKKKSQQ